MQGIGAEANEQQARAWDGPDGDNWTDNEAFYNAAAKYLTPPFLASAAIAPTEHVLDIRCGTGETTRLAARRARSGSAFGIDLSSRMIERARERAVEENLHNARFERADAQVYPFPAASFDVAISRYGSMFFDDPVKAFANIAAALRARGRLVMLCWRELARNEWVRDIRLALAAGRDLPEPPPDVPSPFAFADPDRVRTILTAAGFDHVTFDALEEPMYFGPDVDRAFQGVGRLGIVSGLVADLGEEARRDVLVELRRTLADHQTREGVLFGTSGWLVRAVKAREREES